MPNNHPAVAALPTSASANKTLLRNLLVAAMPISIPDDGVPTDLVAVDPDTGAAIEDILYLGRVFHFDATDTTTANDGVTCLVSNEGRRYKLSDGTDVFAYSVLDNSIATPPVSPTLGDAYLVASSATGAWAGKSDYVATYTIRGWEFIDFGIGRLLYVESVDSYVHKKSDGSWVLGFGNQSLGAGSVPITAVLGANASLVIKVENQTTNTPPSSPTAPTAYIIGSSPTGSWAGNAGKLAICLVDGSFTIISPVAGDQIYDKARNAVFSFNGTAWLATNGVFIDTKTVTNNSWDDYSTPFALDNSIPKIVNGTQTVSATFTPKSITNKLRVSFKADVSVDKSPFHAVGALFLNSNSDAIAASAVSFPAASTVAPLIIQHEFVPGVTSEITLSVRIGPAGTGPTVTVNGDSTTRLLGGVSEATLRIDEIIA